MSFWEIYWTCWFGAVFIVALAYLPPVKTSWDIIEEKFPEYKYLPYY
jgi:hypothetical protein